jgi:small subunit ribosomal protein S27Ae
MHIFVQTLTGKKVDISLETSSSTLDLYNSVEKTTGIPVSELTLLFNKKSIELNGSIADLGMSDNDLVHLVISLEGGAKGKKKKKDVKKNKKPHKKRKVKLPILKFYKIEGAKAVCLRQHCKFCPAGTLLADHGDRLYCGRCHQTYEKAEITKKAPKQKEVAKVDAPVAEEKGKKGKKK